MKRKISKARITKLTKNLKFMVGGSWLDLHQKSELQKWSKKKLIVIITYNAYKMQLPRLRTIRQKALPRRKTKRKARFRKGSPEAKRYMAKIRRMRK